MPTTTIGKRDRVIPRGTGLTQAEEVPNHREDTREQCCLCGQSRSGLFECSKCEVLKYCSVKCQTDHWKVQRPLGETLTRIGDKPGLAVMNIKRAVDSLTRIHKRQLVKLIGEECIIKGRLGDKFIDIPWDTGAQVSLIHFDTFAFLGIESDDIKPLEKVYPNLSVSSASGDKIPYYGVVEIPFKLGENEPITISFLVSDTLSLTRPILIYNVIEHLCCLYGSEDFTK